MTPKNEIANSNYEAPRGFEEWPLASGEPVPAEADYSATEARAAAHGLDVGALATMAAGTARIAAQERGEAIDGGLLTNRQKNEIIEALDGVLQKQGNEDEQTQIAILCTVLAVRRLLAKATRGERGKRMRLIRAATEQFDKSLRKLVNE